MNRLFSDGPFARLMSLGAFICLWTDDILLSALCAATALTYAVLNLKENS